MLPTDQPRHRLAQQDAAALSDAELLAVITAVPCLETAQRLLIAADGLRGLQTISTAELGGDFVWTSNAASATAETGDTIRTMWRVRPLASSDRA